MEPLSAVLRVENGTGGPFDVRQLLARCGEIPLLYPFNGGSAGSAVYFLKFSTEERAAVAQQLGSKTPGISITAIHNSAEWISHFRLASSTGNLYPGSGTPSNDYDPLRKVHGNPFHGSGLTVPDSMPGNAHNDLLFPAYPSSSSTPLSLAAPLCQVDSHPVFGTGNCYPFSFTSNPIDLASKPPLTSSDLLKAGLTYPHSLETSVLMDLRSGIVAYDLERLEDDPASAIHLLKLTKSDIHIWMVIAAHYRRTKRPLAAIEVVFAMMEGFPEADQPGRKKSAQLLLAACSTDLARDAKRLNDHAAAFRHEAQAHAYLQAVYGRDASQALQPQAIGASSQLDHSSPIGSAAKSLLTRVNQTPTPTSSQHYPGENGYYPRGRRSRSPSPCRTRSRHRRSLNASITPKRQSIQTPGRPRGRLIKQERSPSPFLSFSPSSTRKRRHDGDLDSDRKVRRRNDSIDRRGYGRSGMTFESQDSLFRRAVGNSYVPHSRHRYSRSHSSKR